MIPLWTDNPKKAGKEFLVHSLLFGNIIFLIFLFIGWIAHADYVKELFALSMLCILAFGPFAWAILWIVRDATKW